MITKPDKTKHVKRDIVVRNKISGTAECPRLNIFRSNKNIYAQVIDDVAGVTQVPLPWIKKFQVEQNRNSCSCW